MEPMAEYALISTTKEEFLSDDEEYLFRDPIDCFTMAAPWKNKGIVGDFLRGARNK